MDIKTKYNIGDEVYFIIYSEIVKQTIIGISLEVNDTNCEPLTSYYIECMDPYEDRMIKKPYQTSDLYATPEELLKHVKEL